MMEETMMIKRDDQKSLIEVVNEEEGIRIGRVAGWKRIGYL